MSSNDYCIGIINKNVEMVINSLKQGISPTLLWSWFRLFWLSLMTPRSLATETTLSTPWGCGQPRPPVTLTSKTVKIVIITVTSSFWILSLLKNKTARKGLNLNAAAVPQLTSGDTFRQCWTETWLRTSPGFSTLMTMWVFNNVLMPTSLCILIRGHF